MQQVEGGDTMKKFDSVDDVLDHVIEWERESIRFYESLAGRLKNPKIQQVIEEFAREEQGHLETLLAIKKNKTFTCPVEKLALVEIMSPMTPNIQAWQATVRKTPAMTIRMGNRLRDLSRSRPLNKNFIMTFSLVLRLLVSVW